MIRKSIKIKSVNDDILRGYSWECENPEAILVIATGMEEYALRYDNFASFLAENNINVYCIDCYGQGDNALYENDLGIVPCSAFSKNVRIIDDLVKKYSLKGKPTIVLGHSMGSFLIQDYIQRYSKHANKAIIMGSNGPNSNFSYKIGYQLARFVCKTKGENKEAKLLKNLAIGSYAKSVKNRKTDCDWLSYNEENVKQYIDDPKCGHPSSNGFYRELLKGNRRLYKTKFLNKINKKLNILIVSGKDDPVGKFGKGPTSLYKLYKKLEISDVELKLYENLRHEILNEKEKEIVYNDILNFIKK